MSAPASEPAATAAQADDIGEADDAARRSETTAVAESEASENSSSAEPDHSPDGSGADGESAETIGENPTDLADQLKAVTAERNDYLDQLQRQRAEFQNFRRRIESDRQQQIAAGVSRLVESLLPVLDGCDAAVSQGHTEVEAVRQALMVALGKAGLERIDAVGEPFDPTQHEAVTIEQASVPEAGGESGESAEPSGDELASVDDNGSGDGVVPHQVVTAELRSGFRFDGRVLRAAMVKVRSA